MAAPFRGKKSGVLDSRAKMFPLPEPGRAEDLQGGIQACSSSSCGCLGEGCPPVVILENVPGLLSSNGGRDFGVVINALGQLGYSVAWRILDSRFFGVPQSRRRLYIVGYRGDPAKSPRYYLSPNAARGILRRVESQGRNLFPPLKKSLEALARVL